VSRKHQVLKRFLILLYDNYCCKVYQYLILAGKIIDDNCNMTYYKGICIHFVSMWRIYNDHAVFKRYKLKKE